MGASAGRVLSLRRRGRGVSITNTRHTQHPSSYKRSFDSHPMPQPGLGHCCLGLASNPTCLPNDVQSGGPSVPQVRSCKGQDPCREPVCQAFAATVLSRQGGAVLEDWPGA